MIFLTIRNILCNAMRFAKTKKIYERSAIFHIFFLDFFYEDMFFSSRLKNDKMYSVN